MAPMAMFISQETFDDVVKENMEDFGMEKQAALEDALQQFQSQGQTFKESCPILDGRKPSFVASYH